VDNTAPPPISSPSPAPEIPAQTSSSKDTTAFATQGGQKNLKRKRSNFLMRNKVLYIGDSVAHNADFNTVERESNIRIRTVKAYSSVKDDKEKWPRKNMTGVTPPALMKTRKDDDYTHLVLSAPTVDITNLDTSKLTTADNVEYFKQEVVVSCKNVLPMKH
jgi:hypothetical protein